MAALDGTGGALTLAYRQDSRIRVGRVAEMVGRWLIYLVIVVLFLGPFIWMFFGSLRKESEITGYMFPFSWNTIVPVEWTLQNFLDIYGISEAGRKGGLKFHIGLMNSGLISIAVVSCSLVFNTMAAYFFARLPFPGKKYLTAFVVATFLLPFEVTVVPPASSALTVNSSVFSTNSQ